VTQIELESSLDAATLRSAFARFPSGVVAVCGHDGQSPLGVAASSFTSVSLNPPLVSFCVSAESSTWPRMRELPTAGLSVLAAGQGALCRQLASKIVDRFEGIAWSRGAGSSVFIEDAAAWFDCSIADEVPAGDHTIVVLKVDELAVLEATEPLVFHASRFRALEHSMESS
jgi:flavin reductase (DIM6/NTAB) family NADH-FMN oxidoreductase RutF